MVHPDGAAIESMPMEGEWIDGDDAYLDNGPHGGPCCDGACGSDCECGSTCGCGDGCGTTCGGGVHEPGCGCGQPGCCDYDLALGIRDPEACEEVRIRVPRFQEIVVIGGVHGFKGPYDQQRDGGNFGFHEAVNIGAKLPLCDVGYQYGIQTTQSQLSGDANTGDSDAFTQFFMTGGFFRRSRHGLQCGVAWDLLSDERDGSIEFEQMRGELSLVNRGCHEWGGMFAVHLDDFYDGQTTFQATDQYLLFYRMHGARGGEGRLFGGITDDSDGLVGADFLLPLMDRWSLQSEFTYLIPSEDGGTVAARQEAWNIAINLVWHWKFRARSSHSNPYRPLFNVAGNGSLIIDDRP